MRRFAEIVPVWRPNPVSPGRKHQAAEWRTDDGCSGVDPTSGELQPPPNNQTFTRTFLYGWYDGHFIFYEPMITKVHIDSVKTAAGSLIPTPIKLATNYEKPGYYPTKYTIQWDPVAKE